MIHVVKFRGGRIQRAMPFFGGGGGGGGGGGRGWRGGEVRLAERDGFWANKDY